MSLFTFQFLWRLPLKSKLELSLKEFPFGYDILSLNERWGCLLPDFVELPPDGPERGAVLSVSKNLPILYFYDAEDHGWGYEILAEGRSVARCNVDYELVFSLGLEMDHSLGSTIVCGRMNQVSSTLQSVRQTERFCRKVAERLSRANPEEFGRFGLEPTTIEKLRELLTVDSVIRDDSRYLVVEFRKLIGLNERWNEPTL